MKKKILKIKLPESIEKASEKMYLDSLLYGRGEMCLTKDMQGELMLNIIKAARKAKLVVSSSRVSKGSAGP